MKSFQWLLTRRILLLFYQLLFLFGGVFPIAKIGWEVANDELFLLSTMSGSQQTISLLAFFSVFIPYYFIYVIGKFVVDKSICSAINRLVKGFEVAIFLGLVISLGVTTEYPELPEMFKTCLVYCLLYVLFRRYSAIQDKQLILSLPMGIPSRLIVRNEEDLWEMEGDWKKRLLLMKTVQKSLKVTNREHIREISDYYSVYRIAYTPFLFTIHSTDRTFENYLLLRGVSA